MREANGILTLGLGDLTMEGREKKFKEIQYTDIARALDPFKNARVVLLVDDEKGKMKIMKSCYKITL